VVREDGSIVNYKYDGLGRRIEKEVDSIVTQYIYDQEDILLELDGSNNIVARYTHGPGVDEPLIMEKSGVSSFYHADGLGTITELTDNAGTVAQSYTYSSFGRIESQLDLNFIQPYTFTAREFDPETGLYHYRARTYDSLVGRFLQEDPVLRKGDPQTPYLLPLMVRQPQLLHQYGYVVNNPTNFTDQNGRNPAAIIKAGSLAICIVGQALNLISTIRNIGELDRESQGIKDKIKALESCTKKSDAEKLEEFKDLGIERDKIFFRKVIRFGKAAAIGLLLLPFCAAALS